MCAKCCWYGGIDRTQKAIGVVNTAPVYQPLSGFER